MDPTTIWLTLKLATCTTGILFVIGVPLAYWIAKSKWKGKFLVEAVVALPLVLPPTVLGYYVLIATGPKSFVGRGYEYLTGSRLAFSFSGILIGSILYNLPFFGVCGGRSKTGGGLVVPGVLAHRHLLPGGDAAVVARHPDRTDPDLRPHGRGVRDRAHGGWQHSRRDPHAIHRHLRRCAGFEL